MDSQFYIILTFILQGLFIRLMDIEERLIKSSCKQLHNFTEQ